MTVHIDKSIPLRVLAGPCRDQVDRSPGRVADQRDTVFDRLAHSPDMLPEIRDPVGIMDGAVLFHLVKCAKTVLNDHQRHFGVSVVYKVQCIPKPVRIDLPAPIGGFQIGVLRVFDHIACRHLRIGILRHAAGLIIGEGIQIDRARLEDFEVALFDEGCVDPVVFKEFKRELRVLPADLHVSAQIVLEIILSLESEHISRIGRQRIYGDMADHVADHIVGIDLMAQPDRQSGRKELMMKGRICFLQVTLELCQRDRVLRADIVLVHKAKAIQVADPTLSHAGDVDLIEGQPVFDLSFIAPEYRLRIAKEQVDGLPGIESVVFGHNIPRDLIVAQRHKRLNAILAALVKYLVIKSKTGFIGLFVVAVREDPAPVDRKPETGKSHLRKQRYILFVAMIKINSFVAGIKCRLVCPGKESPWRIHISSQQHVRHAQLFSILQIRAFTLIGCHSAAPQKVSGKSHFIYLLTVLFTFQLVHCRYTASGPLSAALLCKPLAHLFADPVQVTVNRIIFGLRLLTGDIIHSFFNRKFQQDVRLDPRLKIRIM